MLQQWALKPQASQNYSHCNASFEANWIHSMCMQCKAMYILIEAKKNALTPKKEKTKKKSGENQKCACTFGALKIQTHITVNAQFHFFFLLLNKKKLLHWEMKTKNANDKFDLLLSCRTYSEATQQCIRIKYIRTDWKWCRIYCVSFGIAFMLSICEQILNSLHFFSNTVCRHFQTEMVHCLSPKKKTHSIQISCWNINKLWFKQIRNELLSRYVQSR